MDDALKAKLVEAIRRALTEYVKARETTASPVATLYADDLATAALSAASTAWQAAGLKLTAREPSEAMVHAWGDATPIPDETADSLVRATAAADDCYGFDFGDRHFDSRLGSNHHHRL